MRSISAIVPIAALLGVVLPAFAEEMNYTWSLPPATRDNFELVAHSLVGKRMAGAGAAAKKQLPPHFYLVAPASEKERTVAIVEEKPSGELSIDPPGFDYGAMPKFKDLNPDAAAHLFGPPERSKYRLLSNKAIAFVLELSFAKEKLVKYRLSAISVGDLLQGKNPARPGAWHPL
ncbi:MAG TPA: hypothetical protein V6C72_03320 [Chroococcales cyanobacterium]